jgi:hypothetical protein
LPAYFVQFEPSGLVAYPIAFGSFCSPPEYHIRNRPASSSQITDGHITAIPFSHGWSAASTGFSLIRFQATPSALVA